MHIIIFMHEVNGKLARIAVFRPAGRQFGHARREDWRSFAGSISIVRGLPGG
jgi:hypothetical protein